MISYCRPAFCVLVLCACIPAFAAEPAAAPEGTIEQEISRQRDIYLSRGDATPAGYTTDRSLLTYTQALASGFRRSLAELDANDRWLDIGAGEGRAAIDYVTSRYEAYFKGFEPHPHSEERARVTALSIEDRRTHRWQEAVDKLPEGQIEYRFGKSLSQYAPDELGRFQLITDVMGGFSYTNRLSVFLERTLALLEVDGSFYTVLADVRAESAENPPHYPGATHLTRIVESDGSETRICSWLKRIACVEVTCEFKPAWTPPVETYRMRKMCPAVRVPALVIEHYEAGTPPERRFRTTDATAGEPSAASR